MTDRRTALSSHTADFLFLSDYAILSSVSKTSVHMSGASKLNGSDGGGRAEMRPQSVRQIESLPLKRNISTNITAAKNNIITANAISGVINSQENALCEGREV